MNTQKNCEQTNLIWTKDLEHFGDKRFVASRRHAHSRLFSSSLSISLFVSFSLHLFLSLFLVPSLSLSHSCTSSLSVSFTFSHALSILPCLLSVFHLFSFVDFFYHYISLSLSIIFLLHSIYHSHTLFVSFSFFHKLQILCVQEVVTHFIQ